MRIYLDSLRTIALVALAAYGLSTADPLTRCGAQDWSQWRGSDQTGAAAGKSYPRQWSEEQGIRWQVEIAGTGGSTPVVAGNRAYLTAGSEGKNHLLCYDVATGKQLWNVSVGSDRGGKHRKGSGANPSAVTDGELTFAYFRSGDIAAVDSQGKVRWQKNLQEQFGEDTLWWDLGTSPLLTEDAVIVAVMQTGPSYLVALDKQSGDVLWQTDRQLEAPEEAAQSYT
ncbi:MAG: PQQ-binding-like beta-propeller repeat protein, partial [Planctomycetaceae bacterium]